MLVFTGVGVALVTLFDSYGAVDVPATSAHAARMLELGVSALIVAGTTGEPMSLDRDERVALIEGVREIAGETPVIAGTGDVTVRQAVRLTRDAIDAGADAVLALAPPAIDLTGYYRAIVSEAAEVPVLAYHFPAIWSPGFHPAALSEFGVAGVKDSSGDAKRLFATMDSFDGAFYPGSPFLLSLAGSQGAAGAILAVANVAPELSIQAFGGDDAAQREVARIVNSLGGNNRWQGIKAATADRFGTSPVTRMT